MLKFEGRVTRYDGKIPEKPIFDRTEKVAVIDVDETLRVKIGDYEHRIHNGQSYCLHDEAAAGCSYLMGLGAHLVFWSVCKPSLDFLRGHGAPFTHATQWIEGAVWPGAIGEEPPIKCLSVINYNLANVCALEDKRGFALFTPFERVVRVDEHSPTLFSKFIEVGQKLGLRT